MSKGFYLSMEAIISLIILISILLVFVGSGSAELSELYLFQKENDLLKVWVMEGKFEMGEMVSDFEFVFSGKGGIIEIWGDEIAVGNWKGEKAISSTAYFYNYNLEKVKIGVTVFK